MSINWNRVAHPGGGTYANPNILKTEQAAKPKAKPKATFARWLNRNGASYDNDIWSQCNLDDFARRARPGWTVWGNEVHCKANPKVTLGRETED